MRFAILLSVLLLTGCPDEASPVAKKQAIEWCNSNKGHLDFHHAGKYDSGPVISMTCYTPDGSRYFSGNPKVYQEICFHDGKWIKPNQYGQCPPPQSTIGHNALGINR